MSETARQDGGTLTARMLAAMGCSTMTAGEVLAATGGSKATVSSRLNKLELMGRVERAGFRERDGERPLILWRKRARA